MGLLRDIPVCAVVALAIGMPAVPAHAQRAKGGRKEEPATAAAAAQKREKARQADEAYKASLKTIPDKPPADPWGGMRSK